MPDKREDLSISSMSSAVGKRERRKPEVFNPADFDAEAADNRGKKRGKDKERDKKRKYLGDSFQDFTDDGSSILQKRISVSVSSPDKAVFIPCRADSGALSLQTSMLVLTKSCYNVVKHNCPPYTDIARGLLLWRRLTAVMAQVEYTSGQAAEWYDGIVAEYDPDIKLEPFLIVFDDSDKERGRIGVSTFRSLKKERAYRWLDAVDTTRPSAQPGATDHSNEGNEQVSKQAAENNAALGADAEQKQPTEKR